MKELTKNELMNIEGGSLTTVGLGFGIAATVIASIVFIIGVIDGYIRPLPCR